MRFRALALAIVAFGAQHNLYAQRLTLPEAARLHGPEPLVQSTVRDLVGVPLEQLLPGADLVVYGRVVGSGASYLSPDQMNIFTDHTLVPLRLIRQRITVVSPTPGVREPPPIVVKQWGGHMVIDGIEVSQIDEDLQSLKVGDEVVLLLTYEKSDNKYVISSPLRAFAVHASRITPFAKLAPLQKYDGMSVAEFEAEIHRLSR